MLNYATPFVLSISIKRYSDGSSVLNKGVRYQGQSADKLLVTYDDIYPIGFELDEHVQESYDTLILHQG